MEQAHQPTTNNHINRYEGLGTCSSIIPGIGIIRKNPLSADLDDLREDILNDFRILDAEGQNS